MSGLADRVRAALAGRTVREERMFGGLAFLVDEKMVVSVGGDGDLLVRVDPARSAQLLARPGAHRAEMGAGRSMGPSWITVDADAVAVDEDLDHWMNAALAYRDR